MSWKKVNNSSSGEVFDFVKPGDAIEGKFVGFKKDVGPNKSMMYYIQDKDEVQHAIWGATALDNQMQMIQVDSQIKIEYLGLAVGEKSKREYRNFQVSVWEDE